MRRAIVHIGHPKTATTFLQHLMLLNRQALADVGFWIPADYSLYGYWNYEQLAQQGVTFGGTGAPLFAELEQERPLEKFDSMFEGIDGDVLISSELFFYYPEFVQQLAHFLTKHMFAVDIIAYVGRYESMAVKAYCQNIKNHGFRGTLLDFLIETEDLHLLRYHRIREQLEKLEAVREVQFRPFAAEFLLNNRIEDDFFSYVSRDLVTQDLTRPNGIINNTLTLPELEAIRHLNKTGNSAAIHRITSRERQVDAADRARIHNYYVSEYTRRYIARNLREDRDRFVATMPADQRGLWEFETADLPEVHLDPRKVQEVLDFALSDLEASQSATSGSSSMVGNALGPKGKRTAFFTICSKNYVHYARVWAKSLAAHHPDADTYLYLADRSDGHIDPESEPFSVIEASELGIPDFGRFSFRYDIMEFNTAIKPYCFSDLMRRNYQNVVYMDPDTRLYDQLDDVLSSLDGGATAVLTPHALSPNENLQPPNDFTFLRSGIYNLGFLALRNTARVRELVEWWERRLVSYCISNRLGDGLFVDQKWVDLWPAYCPGTVILYHPGYNVAYWNLDERELRMYDGKVTVNQMPLKFFHYSGIEPGNRSLLSKHQNRLTMTSLRDAAALFEDYHDDLDRNGLSNVKGWPYAYGTFSNGEPIPAVARWLHREQFEEHLGDPFSNAVSLLNGPADISPNPGGIITRMSHYLWLTRADLREAFRLRDRLSQVQYAQWFVDRAKEEARMPACLVAPVRERLAAIAEETRRKSRRQGMRAITRPVRKAVRRVVQYVGRILRTSEPARLVPGSKKEADTVKGDRQSSEQGAKYTALFADEPSKLSDGIAIIGYAYSESGVGEALRSLARSAVAADIPADVCNFDVHVRARQNDRSIESLVVNRLSRRVNVLSVNADMLQESMSIMGPAAFAGRYNIVRPFWELSNINQQWIPALEQVDEIWAPTTFIMEAFSKSLRRPVFHIPVAVDVGSPKNPSRKSFGLPDQKFLFLFSFDLSSYWRRKNPDAVIEAFCRAFDSSHTDVALVIKTMSRSNDRANTLDRLRRRVGDDPRVCFIDEILDRARAIDLVAACDAFVSLHRAEGFGLGMAEAMSLGKPVIGTDYSGSTDFLSEKTGYPVRFELVQVGVSDYPHYQVGQVWADPDVNHASERMREVYENQTQARFVGQAARQFILDNHSPAVVGETIRDRLQTLGLLEALQPLRELRSLSQ